MDRNSLNKSLRIIIIAPIILLLGFACNEEPKQSVPALQQSVTQKSIIKNLGFKILSEYPHDSTLFTEGLFFDKGYLYESAGMRGQSRLVKYIPGNKIAKEIRMPEHIFSEGISPVGDKIYMLTYTAGKCFVFDKATFKIEKEFNYFGEGWGLDYYKDKLYMTDGSSVIKVIDPKSFVIDKSINVTINGNALNYINELEFAKGYLYANIWQRPQIVKIDIATGNVVAIYDLSALIDKVSYNPAIDVLNGIAYDETEDVFYLTGKLWPKLFKVKLDE